MGFKSTVEKLESFKELPKGWHYGEGDALSETVINLALKIESLLREVGYTKTDCFPGTDQNEQVCGYRDRKCVTIEVTDDGPY